MNNSEGDVIDYDGVGKKRESKDTNGRGDEGLSKPSIGSNTRYTAANHMINSAKYS